MRFRARYDPNVLDDSHCVRVRIYIIYVCVCAKANEYVAFAPYIYYLHKPLKVGPRDSSEYRPSEKRRGFRARNVFAQVSTTFSLQRVVGSLTQWGFLFTIAIGDDGGDKFPGQ